MAGQQVPVAVVGVGSMGRHHARNYASLEHADLRAVVDSDPARGEEVAAAFGAEFFPTVDELLERGPDVAAASIATPTSLHHEAATALLEGGVHVLVEKPLASTLEEADELIQLADSRSLVLAVGHVERFNPAVGELKRRIDEGRLGAVLSIVARRVGLMPPRVKDANVVIDLAVHDIDIFRYLLDAGLPDDLYCNAGRAIVTDRLDFADIFLRYGEVACFLQVNWVTPVKIRSLAVTGTEGYAELEYVTQRLELYRSPRVEQTESFADLEALSEEPPELVEFEHIEPLARELGEFVAAIRGEPAQVVSGEDAKRSMEVAVKVVDLVEQHA